MADRRNDSPAVYRLALILLAACAALHYGWSLAPAQHQAQVWNILGAVARIGLLWLAVRGMPRVVVSVAAWWTIEELAIAGCSALYIAKPWPVAAGQAQCSALLGMDLDKVGAAALVLVLVAVRSYRSRPTK